MKFPGPKVIHINVLRNVQLVQHVTSHWFSEGMKFCVKLDNCFIILYQLTLQAESGMTAKQFFAQNPDKHVLAIFLSQ